MDIEFNEVTFKNLKSLGVERNKNIYTLIEIHRVTGDVTVYNGYFDTNNDGSYKFEVDNDTIDFIHDLEYFDYFYCLKDEYEVYIGGVLREKAYGKKNEPYKQDKYHLHEWFVDDNGTLWRIEGKDKHDRYVLSGRGYQIPQKATEAELDKNYTRWSANNARKGSMLMSEDKTMGILFKEGVHNSDGYIAFAVATREAEDKPLSELNVQDYERTAPSKLVPMTDEEASEFRDYLNRLGYDWSYYIKCVTDNVASVYKVGDWFCKRNTKYSWYRIAKVMGGGNYLMYYFGDDTTDPIYVDDNTLVQDYVVWDITKATDGTPLISKNGNISILFKWIDPDKPSTFQSYAFVRNQCADGGYLNVNESENRDWLCVEFVPAQSSEMAKFKDFIKNEGYKLDDAEHCVVEIEHPKEIVTEEAKCNAAECCEWTPDMLKPYDKVIVRDAGSVWKCAIYSHRRSDGVFFTTDFAWKQCLPYNEETARLVGTNDDYIGKYGSCCKK